MDFKDFRSFLLVGRLELAASMAEDGQQAKATHVEVLAALKNQSLLQFIPRTPQMLVPFGTHLGIRCWENLQIKMHDFIALIAFILCVGSPFCFRKT